MDIASPSRCLVLSTSPAAIPPSSRVRFRHQGPENKLRKGYLSFHFPGEEVISFGASAPFYLSFFYRVCA
jgi:hypothetical protein